MGGLRKNTEVEKSSNRGMIAGKVKQGGLKNGRWPNFNIRRCKMIGKVFVYLLANRNNVGEIMWGLLD